MNKKKQIYPCKNNIVYLSINSMFVFVMSFMMYEMFCSMANLLKPGFSQAISHHFSRVNYLNNSELHGTGSVHNDNTSQILTK